MSGGGGELMDAHSVVLFQVPLGLKAEKRSRRGCKHLLIRPTGSASLLDSSYWKNTKARCHFEDPQARL